MRTTTGALVATELILSAASAEAADELTLQLKWVTQAQYAGYYVALEKGYYEEADLDVTILPGGPDIAPPQVIAGGGADVIIEWMPAALASREKGVALVNIAQIFDRSGMMLTCREDTGIKQPEDFRGHTLGVWFFGNEYPFLSWMSHLGIPTEGGADGVTVLKQGFNVDPLLQKQADCISTMTYNEYWQVIDAGLTPEDLVVFPYEDQGMATLEDGLYVLESSLQDDAMADKLARFLQASIEGWEYAAEHPDEAADIVLEYHETGAQTEEHQRRMMGEINKLVGAGEQGIGYLDPAAYERTVDVLLSGGSDPVITKAPEGAWTHDITDAALGG
jgi:NitT/TauT family transport system substrate-binding protein